MDSALSLPPELWCGVFMHCVAAPAVEGDDMLKKHECKDKKGRVLHGKTRPAIMHHAVREVSKEWKSIFDSTRGCCMFCYLAHIHPSLPVRVRVTFSASTTTKGGNPLSKGGRWKSKWHERMTLFPILFSNDVERPTVTTQPWMALNRSILVRTSSGSIGHHHRTSKAKFRSILTPSMDQSGKTWQALIEAVLHEMKMADPDNIQPFPENMVPKPETGHGLIELLEIRTPFESFRYRRDMKNVEDFEFNVKDTYFDKPGIYTLIPIIHELFNDAEANQHKTVSVEEKTNPRKRRKKTNEQEF